jgi:ssDNA-binding Zn-finger/Zn-ribbon topoisomerase 1
MLRLKSCPRCKGDVLLENDQYGWYEQCLQCGYLRNMETMVEAERQPAKDERTGELARAG